MQGKRIPEITCSDYQACLVRSLYFALKATVSTHMGSPIRKAVIGLISAEPRLINQHAKHVTKGHRKKSMPRHTAV